MFVCLKLCQQLFCANLLLRAFEGKRVLNGLACKYTKSHLDYMLHALGENLYILTSTTSTNTEIPTWTTYSEWEFVCFHKYRNTLICKCQIMKYLDIQILRYTNTDVYKYRKMFRTWTMKSLNFLRWQSHSQGLLSICSCWGKYFFQNLKTFGEKIKKCWQHISCKFGRLLYKSAETCDFFHIGGEGVNYSCKFSKKFSFNWFSSEIWFWISNRT